MSVKEFYRMQLTATDELSELNERLIQTIKGYTPLSVLEFGTGLGKNLKLLKQEDIRHVRGLDINPAAVLEARRNKLIVGLGDETTLCLLSRYDVVFTCSVLCHMPDIAHVVQQLKRIARKAVVVAETTDAPDWRYHVHDYEALGFSKLDFEYYSSNNKRRYHIWVISK